MFAVPTDHTLRRRSFLRTTSLAAAACWANPISGVARASGPVSDHPFQLGVASGDPSADGFVIWTRLAPEPLQPGGGMGGELVKVRWRVGADEALKKIVASGTANASPDWAHSVHVEIGGLEPDRWYWYEFEALGAVSTRGRARTLPVAGAAVDRLRFAFASCQHYETGYYTAYEHMAREDLDLVFHLGDYIYEYAGKDGRVRKHLGEEIESLDDYRIRHAQYKSDPALQAMHAAAPWFVTWDDHEFDNNYADDISEEPGIDPVVFLRRRANAYKAYYEHMPLRTVSLPKGPDMRLYRAFDFGSLARFCVLDTRQYRSDQPCGDGNKPPCGEEMNPEASILGATQRDWLFRQLSGSPAAWNALAQQVMIAKVDFKPGPDISHSMDQWPGYEVERRSLLRFLKEAEVSNPVAFAGDIHSNWANELCLDFEGGDGACVAAEFVGTSISSSGDGTADPKHLPGLIAENPFVKFHNVERGYVTCDVTPGSWLTHYKTVPYVSKPGAPLNLRASFQVENGRPGLNRA